MSDLCGLGPSSYDAAPPSQVEASMTSSMYKVVDLIGTSPDSWEKAASSVVEEAGKHLRDLRVAEVAELDLVIEDGKALS